MKTHTKGNVIVEDIKIGDILYEFEYGMGIKSEVITLPKIDKNGLWNWKCKKDSDENIIINYSVSTKYPQYSPNLYDYKAYKVTNWL